MPDLPKDVSRNPNFRSIKNNWIPWSPATKPIRESRVALVTMGGFYLLGSQRPFTDVDNRGDTSFRPLPTNVRAEDLGIAHTHYDHTNVEQDLNCLFPIALFRTRVTDGVIGNLAETHYSFMGSIPDATQLISDSALEVAARMRQESVDYAILSSA